MRPVVAAVALALVGCADRGDIGAGAATSPLDAVPTPTSIPIVTFPALPGPPLPDVCFCPCGSVPEAATPMPSPTPGAEELCNGVDDDRDGEIDEDYYVGSACEGDGACGQGTIECYDTRTSICSTSWRGSASQAKPERCDDLDNDCDGETDEDFAVGSACRAPGACGHGVVECASPDAAGCSTAPGGSQDESAIEVCGDSIDNDCNGETDERCSAP